MHQPHKLVLHVHPHTLGWAVRRQGHDKPTMVLDERDEAMARALDLAKTCPPSRVVLRDGRGEILEEKRFGPDQWPPRQNEYHFYTQDFGSEDHESGFALPEVRDVTGQGKTK